MVSPLCDISMVTVRYPGASTARRSWRVAKRNSLVPVLLANKSRAVLWR
jgi:hypothetical protein